MKLINNNISPLPFYDNIALQNHRKDYAFGQIYPLIVYRNLLLPFQVVLSTGTNIEWVRLYDFNAESYIDITNSMRENGLILRSHPDFKLLKYPGTLPVVEIKHEGLYYLAISISDLGIVYSDIFSITNNVDDYLLLEYSNSYNLWFKNGAVDFSNNFKFKCYLNTQIGKPEYDFEEEATERMGYTFIESQVSKKIYKFTFLAPEYLCDALRIVRLCGHRQITSKLQTYDLATFSMEPEWEDQGDLASVECEFETDTVIANVGGYVPKLLGGDFNVDFDDDFDDQEPIDSTINITIQASEDRRHIVITADKALKHEIKISVNYRYQGAKNGSGAIIDHVMAVNDTTHTVDPELAEDTYIYDFYDESVSKSLDDQTKYTLQIINSTDISIVLNIGSNKKSVYIEASEPVKSDVIISFNTTSQNGTVADSFRTTLQSGFKTGFVTPIISEDDILTSISNPRILQKGSNDPFNYTIAVKGDKVSMVLTTGTDDKNLIITLSDHVKADLTVGLTWFFVNSGSQVGYTVNIKKDDPDLVYTVSTGDKVVMAITSFTITQLSEGDSRDNYELIIR